MDGFREKKDFGPDSWSSCCAEELNGFGIRKRPDGLDSGDVSVRLSG